MLRELFATRLTKAAGSTDTNATGSFTMHAAIEQMAFEQAPVRTGRSSTHKALLLAAVIGVASTAAAQSYIPPVVTTATTILTTSSGSAPGQPAVDKAGNVYFINHNSPFTLYEIPAASPAVTNAAPVALVTGVGQYNSNGVFVDPKGNLWAANGNGSASVGGSTEYVGFLEIPAGANGVPNVAALSAGETVAQMGATNCTSTTTVPCLWQSNTFATNITSYYSQPSALFVDASSNVYFVDYNGGNIIKFNTATPGTGTLLAAEPTKNNAASVAVDGAGNVYYCDSASTAYGAGGSGKVSLVTGGALTTVGATATITSALISSCTGISADQFGNLYIAGLNASNSNQISEVPFEGTALNFSDQFGIVTALTDTLVYAINNDANGNVYYANSNDVDQVQVNGYNFGNVAVGKTVSPSSSPAAPSLNLYDNVAVSGVSSYFPTGSPTTNTNAAYLQSFPYSGTKSFSGGSSFAPGTNYTITMNFQPIHPGLLTGSFTPRSGGVDSAIVNLQGNGVGPEPLFLPGTPSLLFKQTTDATPKLLNLPQGIALDSYGDIFVADTGNGKVVADCLATTTENEDGTGGNTANTFCSSTGYPGTIQQLGTGFVSPVAIALDGAQSLYVLDNSATGSPVTIINGQTLTSTHPIAQATTFGGAALSAPLGIAVDGYSNIFIADTGNNRIVEAHQFGAAATDNIVVVPSTFTFSGTKLSGPTGVAVDASQDLFIADTGNNRIVKYSPEGIGAVVATGSITLSAPRSVAVYPSGALLVSDANGVYLINGSSSVTLSFGTAYITTGAKGVALDLAGNIYLSNTTGSQVLELNVASPQTLSFPSTNVGSTSNPSTTETVTDGGNASLVLTGLASNSANYTISSASTCTGTSTVPAGQSCSIILNLTPQASASGTVTGAVTLTDNVLSYTLNTTTSNETATFGANGTQILNLTGTATSNKTAQTITFSPLTTPVTYGTTTTETLAATASSGLPVTFSVLSGPGTISGTTLTITGAGNIVVAADQAGNATYAPAAEVTQTVVVNPTPQTITFNPTTPAQYTTTPITLTATGGASGNPVTFTVTSGPGTISGNQLTLSGTGTVVVAANQAGSANFAAAPQVSASIVVNPASQTITFTAPASPVVFNTNPITLTAMSTSNLPVTFSVVSGPATLNGSTLTLTNSGTVVIAANQGGNANYAAAPQVTQTIVVTPIATAATPVFSIVSGTYYGTQALTISDTTPGAIIYYTTNGTAPTTTSQVYSGIITVSSTETVNAIAVATGYGQSAVGTSSITITSSTPSLGLTLNPTTISVAKGQTGTINVSLVPANGENATITLGCVGLPTGAYCSFSPATLLVTPAQTPLSSVLTVTAPTTISSLSRPSTGFIPGTMFALVLGMFGFRKRRRLQTLMLLAFLGLGLTTISGCGSTPTTGSYVVTVTAAASNAANSAAGSVRVSTNFTLNVQ
jgi:hypothetical protein